MSEPMSFSVTLAAPLADAIEQVTKALSTEGFGVLTRIDVHTTLKKKIDVDFRPYVILGACNPPLAHRALSAAGEVGLMLPCNVTVEQAEDTGSLVRIGNPAAMMSVGSFGQNEQLQEVAAEVGERLQRVHQTLGG